VHTLMGALHAWAADPVVLDGVEASEGLTRASFATGRPQEALQAVEVSALVEEIRVEGGSVRWCSTTPAAQASLGYLLERIDAAVGWGEYDKAQQALDEAVALMTCTVSLSSAELARLHLLRGVVAAGEGGLPEALEAFAQARQAEPALPWDEAWPTGREQFETAPQATAPARGYGQVNLDGMALGPEGRPLLPGLHTLTVGSRTGTLQTTLVPVEIVDGSALSTTTFSDPTVRTSAAGSLAGHFGQGTAVLVVSPRAVWSAPAGDPTWEMVERRKASPLVPAGGSVLAVGSLVALASVPVLLGLQGQARQASADMSDATSPDDFVEAEGRYQRATGTLSALRWLPVAGGAVAGTGGAMFTIGLALGPRSVRP
jgi:hypothetical protein